jgi:hypothetical protein
MLKPIFKLLPVFVIIWLSKYCEAWNNDGTHYRIVFDNVLVMDERKLQIRVEQKVYGILKSKLDEMNREYSTNSKKITLIKIMREEEISKILIEAGLVPKNEFGFYNGRGYVGISWAKEWVEENFTPEELT